MMSVPVALGLDRQKFLLKADRVLRHGGCLAVLSYFLEMELAYSEVSDTLNDICKEVHPNLFLVLISPVQHFSFTGKCSGCFPNMSLPPPTLIIPPLWFPSDWCRPAALPTSLHTVGQRSRKIYSDMFHACLYPDRVVSVFRILLAFSCDWPKCVALRQRAVLCIQRERINFFKFWLKHPLGLEGELKHNDMFMYGD